MHALNPFEGEFYRETLARQPLHARDVLSDGRTACPSFDSLSRRRRHGAVDSGLHRLHRAADALRRVHETVPAAARRSCSTSSTRRCLVMKKSAAVASCSAAGARSRIPTSATITIRRWETGAAPCLSRPASSIDGELVTNDLVDINLGMRILLGSSYYEDWAIAPKPLSRPIR